MARKKSDKEPAEVVTFWLGEIAAAKKREKKFITDGERVLKIYDGNKSTPFNILFSNTETLLPALYSAVPRPVVQRRFKDSDPIGKAAALAGQRVLEFLLDTNAEGYETFDEAVRAATLDGLLPGRGVTCVKYDADIGVLDEEPSVTDDEQEAVDSPAEAIVEPAEYKKSELVCMDSRSWNRVSFGYAKKWSKVPWLAYEEQVDKPEAERLFGKEKTKALRFTEDTRSDDEDDSKDEEKNKGARKTTSVYQIWDKDGGRKIRYISAQYPDGYLAELEDPLGLTGFFNCPKPLQFIEKSNDLKPTALYLIYENQATELNQLTLRISRIVKAIKAKGIYDGALGEDIKNLIESDDNMLVPASDNATLASDKGIDNAIWFWPVDKLITVLVQLYGAREQCKQVIYEITGISDILRGSSVASETATAQNIKTQWGTLRLKRLQKEVQRYSRDLLRMTLEVAASKFSEDTWAKMTGLPYQTAAQRQQTMTMAEALKKQGQAMAAANGGQPPPVTPQIQQQIDQIQQQLAIPSWEQVIATLKDDTQRAYRIDIETNSTVEPEAVEDQKNIADLMTALGQFLNGIGPLVAKGVMPFEAAQTMMMAIVRRYRFGPEIEDQIKAMKAPPPADDGKAGAAAEAAAKQAELQAKTQSDAAALQAKAQSDAADRDHKMQVEQMKLAAEERDNVRQESFDRWKAELEATTKIAVAEVAAKAQIKTSAMTVNSQAGETSPQLDDSGNAVPNSSLADLINASNQKMLELIQVTTDSHQQAMAEMVKAITAPRTRTAVRGSDGRIAHAIETVGP